MPGYEHRLWEELAALHAETAGGVRGVGPQVSTGGVPPGGHGRRHRYGAAVAALAAAAAIVAGVVAFGPDRDPVSTGSVGPSASTTAPIPPPVGDEAIVVIHGDGETTWRDEATGAIRTSTAASDQVLRHYEWTQGSTHMSGFTNQALVDHENRTYWVLAEAPGDGWVNVPSRAADGIASEVDQGGLTADGREVVGGRELLRYLGPPATTTVLCGIPGDPRGFTVEQCDDPGVERDTVAVVQRIVWVDPGTGRPVQEAGDHDFDGNVETTTYEFLPRTPENLELLEVVIPEGYTEVTPDR